MLGLPDTPALDARARVERVDHSPPEKIVCDRRCGHLVVARCRLAEQKPESWPGGTKLSRRCHREVELKRVRQQEHSVGGRTALEIDKVHRVPLTDERPRPIVQHLSDRYEVGDGESEVQVGEPVAAVHGKRAHHGSGDDALILRRELQHVFSESIPLLNGEHEPP
jgi:hypothetical protein